VTFRGNGIGAAGAILRRDVFAQGAGEWSDVKPRHRTFQGRNVFLEQAFELRGAMLTRPRFDLVGYIAWSEGLEQYLRRRRPACEELPR
jgi:hypothetical protein